MTVAEIMEKIQDIRDTKTKLREIRESEITTVGQAEYIVDAEVYLEEYLQELSRKKVQ